MAKKDIFDRITARERGDQRRTSSDGSSRGQTRVGSGVVRRRRREGGEAQAGTGESKPRRRILRRRGEPEANRAAVVSRPGQGDTRPARRPRPDTGSRATVIRPADAPPAQVAQAPAPTAPSAPPAAVETASIETPAVAPAPQAAAPVEAPQPSPVEPPVAAPSQADPAPTAAEAPAATAQGSSEAPAAAAPAEPKPAQADSPAAPAASDARPAAPTRRLGSAVISGPGGRRVLRRRTSGAAKVIAPPPSGGTAPSRARPPRHRPAPHRVQRPEPAAAAPRSIQGTGAPRGVKRIPRRTPAAEAKPAPKAMSLEDVLRREEGIVQHKPKKGRRVVAEQPRPAAPQPPARIIPSIARRAAAQAALRAGATPTRTVGSRGGRKTADGRDLQRRPSSSGPARTGGGGGGRRRRVRPGRGAGWGRRGPIRRRRRKGIVRPANLPKEAKRFVEFDSEITIRQLAEGMARKAADVLIKVQDLGMEAEETSEVLDFETAELVAAEFGWTLRDVTFREEDLFEDAVAAEEDPNAQPRAPIVTVMGHVDHGKTTLMDAIRGASVAGSEAGGITQGISAFEVPVGDGSVTFVDTPGHEAFTAMRERGAQVTDIVILVVAADDGVMPQTREVIKHARAADVPIVVAINKVDKDNANPDRVKQQLAEFNLIPEEWGGDTIMVPVSALQKQGLDELLEQLQVLAEVMEYKANPKREARGRVLEARIDKGRGPIVVGIVQEGTLRPGEWVVCGTRFGRVRALFDSRGKKLKTAGPSAVVELMGLDGLPRVGDLMQGIGKGKSAKKIAAHRAEEAERARVEKTTMATRSIEELFASMSQAETKELRLILKADVQGSLAALEYAFGKIAIPGTKLVIQQQGVGQITLSDIESAVASGYRVIGFNTKMDRNAERAARQADLEVPTFKVIYDAVDFLREQLIELLPMVVTEVERGTAQVRELFRIPRIGVIAGCAILKGTVARSHIARVKRGEKMVWEGRMSSLKRFKDDVREVREGYECGIGLDGFEDLIVGDIIQTYEREEKRPTFDLP